MYIVLRFWCKVVYNYLIFNVILHYNLSPPNPELMLTYLTRTSFPRPSCPQPGDGVPLAGAGTALSRIFTQEQGQP